MHGENIAGPKNSCQLFRAVDQKKLRRLQDSAVARDIGIIQGLVGIQFRPVQPMQIITVLPVLQRINDHFPFLRLKLHIFQKKFQ